MKTVRLVLLWLVALMSVGYLLPGVLASVRRHPDAGSIWLLNILLGWTIVGWFWTLVKSAGATYSNVRIQENR
jgi:hypothetical protein